ncbi:hypothetical protein HPHPP25_0691 [Helicobacter pylori Hp P-25]|nr:hypothetical protein HPHPP25_0691 [Helicobacter pylori Hp P-25]EJC35186.1 hypothetical protein HPHPP25C_0517 [Helicobacter pylori Hp P-25c]EJC35965.1 hypothetical protein HPHPP25D_1570 [Helicobacter pylori Hp P-25d]
MILDYECYYLNSSPFLAVAKTPKQTQALKDNNLFECCGIWLIFILNHFQH